VNKYESRAQEQRKSTLRSSMMMGTAGVALFVIGAIILGLYTSAPSSYYTRAGIIAAVSLVIVRQLNRRMRGRSPRASRPDPQSMLNLK